MAKLIEKTIVFQTAFKKKIVRDLKIVTTMELVSVVAVCTYDPSMPVSDSDAYEAELQSVVWNGTDVKDLIEILDQDSAIIEDACREMFALLNQNEAEAA